MRSGDVYEVDFVSSLAAGEHLGTVGPAKLSALREVLSDILGMA